MLLSRFALAQTYDPPATYYDYAAGTIGSTLKQRLKAIIDETDDSTISNSVEVISTPMSYDAARSSLQVTDADTAHAGHIITVYDRTSLNVSGFNTSGIPGWDGGTTWNREHTWPRSRGIDSSGPDDSDLFNLRPALTSNNGDRGNLNYGGAFGQPWGVVSDGGSKWYPGDADAGMIARQEFYMATRYDGSDSNTTNLELFTGDPTAAQGLGDLKRMLEWHFAAPPDAFERRRNQVIFDNYQHNRNPFIDHPEYVWSIFGVDQAGNAAPNNDSRISIAGTTVNANGSSTKNVDLGRVLIGGAVPAAQVSTLNKAGQFGTYYEVTTTGAATSSISGRLNAFRTYQTDSKSISVGLSMSTALAGVKTGTVIVDNLDITTGGCGGVGCGANDANDTFNVSLNVLDHMTPSLTSPSLLTSKTLDFGNIALGSSASPLSFSAYDLNGVVGSTSNMDFDSFTSSGNTSAFTTNLAASAGSLQVAAGSSQTFMASMNVTNVGTFSATYTLNFSDENLTGAQTKSLTLTLTGKVRLAGDYNNDGVVNASDYILWRQTLGQTGVTAYSGADGDGNGKIESADFFVWRSHFGETPSSFGAAAGAMLDAAAVPEPTALWLTVAGVISVWVRPTRRAARLPVR